ncbi:PREDICTED: uncharacterized protein LOC106314105 [Brassica oleracea var. oleracea]|uniref:uncharacterized protein LOC106314105 n=1 Tax=Brassica oleracea var. oleracea TaxID=109376 RepID=UPI0006A6F638|nr:PREDICTED: uncharacterized protein LOC106314105 [Brassica oleracea var. oleracea]
MVNYYLSEYKKGNLTIWFFISERTKIKKRRRETKTFTKKIKVKNGVVGYKTTLNYFVGKQPNRARTNWLMQECWLESSGHNKTIYLSPTAKKNMKEEDVEELEEEAVQPRTVENQQPQRQPQFYPTPTPLLHDIAYHEPQPPDTVQDQLPQFWAAPLDSYPPRCHDIQYSQPRPLDAIEYQYLYQSGPLTTYENVIESCTQDKSNGDIKKIDMASSKGEDQQRSMFKECLNREACVT